MAGVEFQDLPVAHRDREWSGDLTVVPRAVFNAAAVMQGGRGGADLPKGDIDRVKAHLARYYDKMGDTAPWEE